MNPACTAESRGRHRSFVAALVVFIIVILVAAPQAAQQQQQPPASFATNGGLTAPAPPAAEINATSIDLLVGRSTILNVGATVTRVSLTVPDIADALVTTPTQLLIHGKQPGIISMFVWDKSGAIRTYEVNVRRDLSALKEQVKQLFPGEGITVTGSGKDVVLSGVVSGQYVIDKAGDVATGFVEKKENVVNLLKQREGVASNQVLLRVRFAEVSRNALQELGVSLFSDGNNNYFGRTSTQQFAAPFFDKNKAILGQSLVFSDYLNLFLFDAKNQIGAVVKALQTKGVFQSLAEPNLVALNGKEASFLAGGEFPYPVVQGAAGGNAVTIMFKEFGIRLNFTPTVLGGDLINLKLKPEVSSLDFSNGVVVEGFRVPALSSRRADTEVELHDGQTFAIAGLMNNTALQSMQKVPGIGDIPILGNLFKSRSYQKDQTELVVMVTPTILRRDSTGASESLPSMVEPFLGPPAHPVPPPAPYVGSPRYPAPGQPAPRGGASAPAPQSQAAPLARPIQGSAALPNASVPASDASPSAVETAPAPSQQAQPAPMAAPAPTKDELKAAERARVEDAKKQAADHKAAQTAAAVEEKQQTEQARKDAEAKRRAEKLEKERAAHEAEVAKKKAAEDAKREKALADAAARLKAAQSQYQEELEKTKGDANDKAKTSGKGSTPKS
jgi:pilus assembly protein CpaC